jgi:hypothetical protein
MSKRYALHNRLEVAQPLEDLNRGFLAEVYDPAWFLGRQWQLGEHQGEDASSPVAVSYIPIHQPLDPLEEDPLQDPTLIPPEAIVESEPGDWWTPGRRIRIGAEAAAAAGLPPVAEGDPTLLLADLPTPYDRLNGLGYDGFLLYQQRGDLELEGLDAFADVPPDEPTDLWSPAELVYEAQFTCGGRMLSLPWHAGGHIDWYSVDADGPLPVPALASTLTKAAVTEVPVEEPEELTPIEVLPSRMRYPGAPHPRWWQIEDAQVDIGGFPPDRGHFPTMLLIDLVVSHSDDWFLFPIAAPAGHAVTLHQVTVRDAFGDDWDVTPPEDDWSLFEVTGLDKTSLLVWATVTTPLSGPVLEDVALGMDEDANMLWAVEQRVAGRDLPTVPRPEAQLPNGGGQPVVDARRKSYAYLPSTPMFPYWHPYPIADVGGRRRFIQGRLADLAQAPPALLPEPRARVLYDRQAPARGPVHQIEPATVPSLGLRLERRYMLARGTDGLPALWSQRRRLPLLAPPAPHLRFDVMEEEITEEA